MRIQDTIDMMLRLEYDFSCIPAQLNEESIDPDEKYIEIKEFYLEELSYRNNFKSKQNFLELQVATLKQLVDKMSLATTGLTVKASKIFRIIVEDLVGELEMELTTIKSGAVGTIVNWDEKRRTAQMETALNQQQLVVFIQLLERTGFFLPNIDQQDVAKAMYLLTGYSWKNLNNFLGESKFTDIDLSIVRPKVQKYIAKLAIEENAHEIM